MARLTIDPDRLAGTAIDKTISTVLTGFTLSIKKVFGSFNKLSQEQWESLRDNMLTMSNKFKSSQKVLGNNLKYLEEQAKTNEKAAKLLEQYKKGESVLGIISKIENKEKVNKEEIQKLNEAFKESESLSDVLFNLTIKKSDKLRELVGSIGEDSLLSVEKQTEFAGQMIEALKVFGLDKNKKVLTGSGITQEKGESISEAIEKAVKLGQLDAMKIVMENAAKMSEKSKKDEIKISASELGKLGLGIKKGEFREKVSSKEERSMMSIPNGISTGISTVTGFMDQAGEIILLLAILLPIIWKFVMDKLSGKPDEKSITDHQKDKTINESEKTSLYRLENEEKRLAESKARLARLQKADPDVKFQGLEDIITVQESTIKGIKAGLKTKNVDIDVIRKDEKQKTFKAVAKEKVEQDDFRKNTQDTKFLKESGVQPQQQNSQTPSGSSSSAGTLNSLLTKAGKTVDKNEE